MTWLRRALARLNVSLSAGLKSFSAGCGRVVRRLARLRRPDVDWTDLALLAGLVCIVRGLALIYVPLGWIFAGTALCWIGLRAGRGGR